MKDIQKPKLKILISCHKPTAYIQNDILTPIQVGAANSRLRLNDMLYDDEGENISKLNPSYCELTAQYWAWKNLDLDYYGFCHYRRYFNFSNRIFKEDGYGNIIEHYPGKYIIDKYGQDENTIYNAVNGYDILVAKQQDVRKNPYNNRSIRNHYHVAPLLHDKDLELMEKIIAEKTPEYINYTKKILDGHKLSFCNMYILKKELFFEYCEWMFSILDEFYKRTDMSTYSTEALRTPGHLSERLFNIFLARLQAEKKELKIKELQCVYFEKTDPQEDLDPIFKSKAVPVVFAANNNFVPIFSTCLRSVIDSSSINNNYDIILVQSDITQENKNILLNMIKDHKNFSLRFYDAAKLLSDYKLEAKEHISVETYYRFLIQDAMPRYDKVLYIDCDLIVKHDLAELYNTDLEGFMLAACYDPDFIGQVNGANKDTKEYAVETLKLNDPYNYFQAGVILFNETEMRKAHDLSEWLDFATKPYRYSDQDVLNIHCQGKVKYLDMAWNMLTDCNHERVENVIKFAPSKIQHMYQVARKNPYIIHYAGFMKPWYKPSEDFAQDFWTTARYTPYYEVLIEMAYSYRVFCEIDSLARAVSPKGKTKRYTKRVYRKLIRSNSGIDRAFKKILKK